MSHHFDVDTMSMCMLTLMDTLIFTHCHTVIMLFNAIQQSQASVEDAQVAAQVTRGSGKATLAAPPTNDESKKRKWNALFLKK